MWPGPQTSTDWPGETLRWGLGLGCFLGQLLYRRGQWSTSESCCDFSLSAGPLVLIENCILKVLVKDGWVSWYKPKSGWNKKTSRVGSISCGVMFLFAAKVQGRRMFSCFGSKEKLKGNTYPSIPWLDWRVLPAKIRPLWSFTTFAVFRKTAGKLQFCFSKSHLMMWKILPCSPFEQWKKTLILCCALGDYTTPVRDYNRSM